VSLARPRPGRTEVARTGGNVPPPGSGCTLPRGGTGTGLSSARFRFARRAAVSDDPRQTPAWDGGCRAKSSRTSRSTLAEMQPGAAVRDDVATDRLAATDERWPFSEPTLRSDPVASPGLCATASTRSGSAARQCCFSTNRGPPTSHSLVHKGRIDTELIACPRTLGRRQFRVSRGSTRTRPYPKRSWAGLVLGGEPPRLIHEGDARPRLVAGRLRPHPRTALARSSRSGPRPGCRRALPLLWRSPAACPGAARSRSLVWGVAAQLGAAALIAYGLGSGLRRFRLGLRRFPVLLGVTAIPLWVLGAALVAAHFLGATWSSVVPNVVTLTAIGGVAYGVGTELRMRLASPRPDELAWGPDRERWGNAEWPPSGD
jgi:hypothetical protein